MAVRSPLKNDSGNLKEMSSAEVDQVVDQIIYQYSLNPGVTLSVVGFSFILSYGVFLALKATIGLRISKEAEKLGTDKAEIGVVAYSIRD